MGKEYQRPTEIISQVPAVVFPSIAIDFSDDASLTGDNGTGTDYRINFDTKTYLSGGAALHLQTRTTSAAQNDTVQIQVPLQILDVLKYEYRITWNYDANTLNKMYLEFWFYIPSITNTRYDVYKVRLHFSGNTATLQIDEGSGYSAISGTFKMSNNMWAQMIAKIDPSGRAWDTIKIGDKSWDVSDQTYESSSTGDSYHYILIRAQADATNSVEAWIDQIVVREGA